MNRDEAVERAFGWIERERQFLPWKMPDHPGDVAKILDASGYPAALEAAEQHAETLAETLVYVRANVAGMVNPDAITLRRIDAALTSSEPS